MKEQKYLWIRIAVLIGISCIIFVASKYALPAYIREDSFGFVAELDRIFLVELIFVIIFLLFILLEIFTFNKVKERKLLKLAITFSLFLALLVIGLAYLNYIY